MEEKSDLTIISQSEFSETKFLTKLRKVFKIIGRGLTEKLFLLYNLFTDSKVPKNVKLIIAAGISYFILPFDTIPDFLVGIGFTDDLAVVLGIVYMLTTHITEEHKQNAKQMADKLFDMK